MKKPQLTHLDSTGRADMVDVGHKVITRREASAEGYVYVAPATMALIREGNLKKGDVITIARIAGIMGAKETHRLIPLCHPLMLDKIGVEITLDEAQSRLHIIATARVSGQTGVEMEALTAVSIACLTIYDMAKAVDRAMRIDGIRLLTKSGGQSGDYRADDHLITPQAH